MNNSVNFHVVRIYKKSPTLGSLLIEMSHQQTLYELLDLSAPQATSTNLDRAGSAVDQRLDRYEIGAEYALCGNANVLTNTTVLLGLTFSRNTIPSNRSFSANLTSTSHSYIHLVLIIRFWADSGLSKSWLSLYGHMHVREQ
jgi:hypothetical protein